MEILGVDFSGARPDNNTWVARGWLDGRELVLESCRPVSRTESRTACWTAGNWCLNPAGR